jgi:hypothetical protein
MPFLCLPLFFAAENPWYDWAVFRFMPVWWRWAATPDAACFSWQTMGETAPLRIAPKGPYLRVSTTHRAHRGGSLAGCWAPLLASLRSLALQGFSLRLASENQPPKASL